MIGVILFLASFLVLFGITTVIPSLPPGEIFYALLGISEITSPISGISGVVFVNGVINGLFWGIIISIIFSVFSAFSRNKVPNPKWVPSYRTAPPSTSNYIPPLTYSKKPIRKVRKTRTQTLLDKEITSIEGIGRIYGKRLRKIGVRTLDDLLMEGYNRSGRYQLAEEIGVSTSTVFKWVSRADFFRIDGIGKQYSSLLESAGITSVSNLSRRDPNKIYERLKRTNWRKNLVKRIPTYTMVEEWIESAKNLRPIVIN
jgi:predicted flap endonuclease-1-like 5' DNA nuclease